jgi:hypothetical protein
LQVNMRSAKQIPLLQSRRNALQVTDLR